MRFPFRSIPALLLLSALVALAACSDEAPNDSGSTTAGDATAPADAQASEDEPNRARPVAAVTPQVPLMEASTRLKLMKVLESAHRPYADRARDAYRHPLETLSFFGLQRNLSVVEITPGAGWYADILAPTLVSLGKYSPAIWDESIPGQPEYRARLNQELLAKFATDFRIYGHLRPARFNPFQPQFGPPGSADLVLSFRNAHNWVADGTAEATFAAIAEVLKPGGTLGLVDHRAPEGPPTDGKNVYVTEAQVIELARAAGLDLADRSEINANPKDTKDYSEGVWTLPPTLALGEEDKARYVGIGESDRMTLRFIKR
jgi:predicted methyltransferase